MRHIKFCPQTLQRKSIWTAGRSCSTLAAWGRDLFTDPRILACLWSCLPSTDHIIARLILAYSNLFTNPLTLSLLVFDLVTHPLTLSLLVFDLVTHPLTINPSFDLVTYPPTFLILARLWSFLPSTDLILVCVWSVQPSTDIILARFWSCLPSTDLILARLWSCDPSTDLILAYLWSCDPSTDLIIACLWSCDPSTYHKSFLWSCHLSTHLPYPCSSLIFSPIHWPYPCLCLICSTIHWHYPCLFLAGARPGCSWMSPHTAWWACYDEVHNKFKWLIRSIVLNTLVVIPLLNIGDDVCIGQCNTNPSFLWPHRYPENFYDPGTRKMHWSMGWRIQHSSLLAAQIL